MGYEVLLHVHPDHTAASNPPCNVQGGEKQGKVTKLTKNEVLMLNIGSMCTGARVVAVGLLARPLVASHLWTTVMIIEKGPFLCFSKIIS